MENEDLIRNINPFGLRMQPSLKSALEESAKEAKRSLNAEIVARLEASIFKEVSTNSIVSASKAKELAAAARTHIAAELRNQVIAGLNSAISKGATFTAIDWDELDLWEMSDTEFEEVAGPIAVELSNAGYSVEYDRDSMRISF